MLVSLSYAEGTAAFPETGGAATFVRRAFNDPLGFLTGWALFLDYLIVIALAALFMPHYIGTAVGWDAVTDEPWDVVVGVGVIVVMAALRLVRRSQLYRVGDRDRRRRRSSTHLLLVGLGFAILFSPDGLTRASTSGTAPTWDDARVRDPAGDARVHGAGDGCEPGRGDARARTQRCRGASSCGIGAVVLVSVAIAVVGALGVPAPTPDGMPSSARRGCGAAGRHRRGVRRLSFPNAIGRRPAVCSSASPAR